MFVSLLTELSRPEHKRLHPEPADTDQRGRNRVKRVREVLHFISGSSQTSTESNSVSLIKDLC